MLLRAAIITGLLLGSLPAQTPETPAPPASDKLKPCTVTGQVVSASDSVPIKSARVSLIEESRSAPNIHTTFTDGSGNFTLKDVMPGRYEFFASHNGFINEHYRPEGASGSPMLSLKPGEEVKDVAFHMTAAAVITGRVVNEEGEAMPKMRVEALRWENDEDMDKRSQFRPHKREMTEVASSQTDDRGQFRIFGLKPGQYYLRAFDYYEPDYLIQDEDFKLRLALGKEYASLYYPGVIQLDEAQKISLRPGDEAQADFSLRKIKTVTIYGRVVGPNGPAASARLSIDPVEGDERDLGYNFDSTSDTEGNFQLRGIPAGRYTISAAATLENQKKYRARMTLQIGEENVNALTISLGGGATVHGHITTDSPKPATFEHATVLLSDVDQPDLYQAATVNKDRSFSIESVADGNYSVRLLNVNPWNGEQRWHIKSARFGQEDMLAKPLHVERGAADGSLEIVLSSVTGELSGTVTEKEKPVPGAAVRIAPDPETAMTRERVRNVKTDQSGRFVVADLVPGSYRVVAHVSSSDDGNAPSSDPQAVTVGENEKKSVSLTIPEPKE
jgi:hypothetical protein